MVLGGRPPGRVGRRRISNEWRALRRPPLARGATRPTRYAPGRARFHATTTKVETWWHARNPQEETGGAPAADGRASPRVGGRPAVAPGAAEAMANGPAGPRLHGVAAAPEAGPAPRARGRGAARPRAADRGAGARGPRTRAGRAREPLGPAGHVVDVRVSPVVGPGDPPPAIPAGAVGRPAGRPAGGGRSAVVAPEARNGRAGATRRRHGGAARRPEAIRGGAGPARRRRRAAGEPGRLEVRRGRGGMVGPVVVSVRAVQCVGPVEVSGAVAVRHAGPRGRRGRRGGVPVPVAAVVTRAFAGRTGVQGRSVVRPGGRRRPRWGGRPRPDADRPGASPRRPRSDRPGLRCGRSAPVARRPAAPKHPPVPPRARGPGVGPRRTGPAGPRRAAGAGRRGPRRARRSSGWGAGAGSATTTR